MTSLPPPSDPDDTSTGDPFRMPRDEERAREALIGSLAHDALVAVLSAAADDNIDLRVGIHLRWALRAADRVLDGLPAVDRRAHRQVLASSIFAYVEYLLPPPGWTHIGSETPLGPYRVDLLWGDAQQRVLIDELKTGRLGVGLADTHAQVQRYLTAGAASYQDRFLGVRVLCTAHPARSWLASRSDTAPLLRSGHLARPWRLKRLPTYPTLAGRPFHGPRDPPRWAAALLESSS